MTGKESLEYILENSTFMTARNCKKKSLIPECWATVIKCLDVLDLIVSRISQIEASDERDIYYMDFFGKDRETIKNFLNQDFVYVAKKLLKEHPEAFAKLGK